MSARFTVIQNRWHPLPPQLSTLTKKSIPCLAFPIGRQLVILPLLVGRSLLWGWSAIAALQSVGLLELDVGTERVIQRVCERKRRARNETREEQERE